MRGPSSKAATRPLFVPGQLCCDVDGFSLHAKVCVREDERERLERLCRYVARPPIGSRPEPGRLEGLSAAWKAYPQVNGKALELLLPLIEGGIPGEGGNGAFSHPVVLANGFDAVLDAAGLPLDERQLERLRSLTLHYSGEDDNLRLAAESEMLGLASIVDEMEMKGRLYDELEQVLNAEQRTLLFPEASRGLESLELFGVGADWGKFAHPIKADGPEDFAGTMTMTFQNSLNLSAHQTEQVRVVMEQWASTYPPSYWSAGSSDLDRRGFMHVDRIQDAAVRQIDLFHALLQGVDLAADQRAAIERSQNVLVPLPRS